MHPVRKFALIFLSFIIKISNFDLILTQSEYGDNYTVKLNQITTMALRALLIIILLVSSIITLFNIATVLNAKKNIPVKDATYAIAKRKHEIIQV